MPDGARIYPQSTLTKILQRNFSDNSYFANSASNFSTEISQPQEIFSAFPQALQLNDLTGDISSSSSTTNNSRTDNGVTVTGNTFNIRKDSDINEIAFRLFELMFDADANYVGA